MKKISIILALAASISIGGCQTFQKDRDLELYIVGAALVYAGAKHICRHSQFEEQCAVGAAVGFVAWY